MAKRTKPTHEQLQRDEIADGVLETVETIMRNRMPILFGVLALIVLALAIRFVVVHQEGKQKQLSETLAFRMGQYQQLTGGAAADEKARLDGMKSLINDLNTDSKTWGTGSPLSRDFIFLKGLAHYSVDQFAEAQKAYSQYVDSAKNNEERARGEIALAYAYENQSFFPTTGTLTQRGLLDQALTHYTNAGKAAGGESEYLYYYALLGQARINELLGNSDKAIQLYTDVAEKRKAPVPVATPAENGTDASEAQFVKALREMLDERESQLSFAATAKLRLDRLQARASLAPAVTTTVTTAPTTAQ